MKLLRKLSLVLLTGLAFISCQKEYSEENGGSGGSGEATGTLKAAGTGECLPSSVQGVFIVGTAVNTSNYINVDVDITALGTYTIVTDVKSGISFSATGVATTTGVQTIKLTANASGIPTTAGATTFTVTFGSSQCNIVVDIYPAGTGNAVLTINCAGVVLGGTYTQNTPTTSANTVQVEATVTTAGLYNISTNTVNGVSFSGTGFLAAGTSMVTLVANGGTPTASGVQTYTVTAGTSTCTFDIDYVAGTTPPVGGFTWSFTVGSTTYSGVCDEATITTTPFGSLDITGENTTANSIFSLSLVNFTGPIAQGTYSGNATGGSTKLTATFGFSQNPLMYSFVAAVSSGTIINSTISSVDAATHVIQGTFSGTAKDGGGATVTISNGTFKVHYP